MFKNYVLIATRCLFNNKMYSAINILGLAIGLAACILIMLFVRYELSFDQHWKNADRLYRLSPTFHVPGRETSISTRSPGMLKPAFEKYFEQEIEHVTRLRNLHVLVELDGEVRNENILWTDPETVDMFDLNVIFGDYRQTLNDKTSLMINQSFSKKYFGDDNPLGKIISIEVFGRKSDYKIGAVFEDLPQTTVLNFQALTMIDETDFEHQSWLFKQWFIVSFQTFYQLKEGVSADSVSSRLNAFTNDNMPNPFDSEQDKPSSDFIQYASMNIQDLRLDAKGRSKMRPGGSKLLVVVLTCTVLIILLIACINFINLTTAKSTQREREVALRKALGARRGQIIVQFLGESLIIAFASLMVAIATVELCLPFYNIFLDKNLLLTYTDPITLSTLLGLVAIVGLIGGTYPALVLSNFKPAQVFQSGKSTHSASSSSSSKTRSILVVFQFSVSIVLFIATAVIYAQTHHMSTMDPGFNKNNLLAIQNIDRLKKPTQIKAALEREMLKLANVKNLSFVGGRPGIGNDNTSLVEIPGAETQGVLAISIQIVEHDFFSTFEIPLLAGRTYNRKYSRDSDSVEGDIAGISEGNIIVNQRALSLLAFGTPEEALGRVFRMQGNVDLTIVGVVPDTLFKTSKQIMRPSMYLLSATETDHLAVRFDGNPIVMVKALEKLWQRWVPDMPFVYSFADQDMAAEFEQEAKAAKLLAFFSILAVIIGCLGLFGLVSFSVEHRKKEIGLRKVMGASTWQIVKLMVWQFSKPVLLANILAWPVATWAMIVWLETFPYRLDSWVLLPLCFAAAAIALIIAWLTVGTNARKVAQSNPIDALRYE
jgi:putative ABC transport system permease protein